MDKHTKIEFTGKRLQITARSARIDFEESFYWKPGRFPKRIVTGIFVAEKDAEAMRQAIAARNSNRKTPIQKSKSRQAKQEKESRAFKAEILLQFRSMPNSDAEKCARHASEIGSGRIGRSNTAENPAQAAVIAYVRHNFTEYESLLSSGHDREEARMIVGPKIRKILDQWQT